MEKKRKLLIESSTVELLKGNIKKHLSKFI